MKTLNYKADSARKKKKKPKKTILIEIDPERFLLNSLRKLAFAFGS